MLSIEQVLPNHTALIKTIASWYWEEWQVPREQTMLRLANQHPDDLHFHLVLNKNEQAIATGGLYVQVGLPKTQPAFNRFGPWVGLVYTVPEQRKLGYGALVLKHIEERASQMGYIALYLYTHTAEHLYQKNGWTTFDHANYRGHHVAVMEKSLAQ